MKVNNVKGLVFSLFVSTALFFSCSSTNNLSKNKSNLDSSSDKNSLSELNNDYLNTNDLDSDDLKDELQNLTSTSENTISVVPSPVVPAIVLPSNEEIYLKNLSNISIKIIESPSKQIDSGKSFDKPYTVQVTSLASESLENESVISDLEIKITYPAGKDKDHTAPGNVILNTIIEKTDSDGKVSFVPENTNFSAFEAVTFSPVVPEDLSFTEEESELLSALLEEKTVSAPWKVRSKTLYNKGAVLFVWDFSEKNNPVNNSYELLSELRKRVSYNFGNAPVNETSDIGKPLSTLYNLNYEIIGGDAYGYLIPGTIKFTQKVALVEGTSDYLCSLVASISAVNMKNGEIVFDTQIYQEATGSNWNKAVSNCKTQLSEKIVDALIYGL